MTVPFFSIIIPTLNEEKTISNVLRDLTKQTYSNFEVIVVDGTSEDDTMKHVAVFNKKLTITLIETHKRSVGYQKNLGGHRAHGDFLVFLDADVRIDPSFLSVMYKTIQKKNVAVLTSWFVADDASLPYPLLTLGAVGFVEFAKLIRKPFACAAIVCKKKVFGRLHGFIENLTIGEDHDFTNRAYQMGFSMEIVRKPLFAFSMRRLKKEGIATVTAKYSYAAGHFLLFGPMKKTPYQYKMGGQAHE